MPYCVNYCEMVDRAFEASLDMPEWSRPWMRKRLLEHLARDSGSFLDFDPARGYVRDCWAFLDGLDPGARAEAETLRTRAIEVETRARRNGDRPVRFLWKGEWAMGAQRVRDWLHALPDGEPSPSARSGGLIARRKLGRMTFAQALAASERWHAVLARRAERDGAIVGDPDAVETVLALPNGLRWVRLLTPEARDFEGAAMGHCAGTGGYDDREILSLRDRHNRPHCTVERGSDREFKQVKGRGNGPVAEKYAPAVVALADLLEPPRVRDAGLFGCAWISRPGRGIPSGLVVAGGLADNARIRGDLTLHGCRGLRALPRGLHVEGNLELSACDGLEALPGGLRVGGSLVVVACEGLRDLPEDLAVGRDLHLEKCPALRRLPAGVRVGRNLYLKKCDGLEELPALRLRGSAIVYLCDAFRRLPGDLRVGTDLEIHACPALTALPDGLLVPGDLWVMDCPDLARLPARLAVGADLRISRCTGLREAAPGVRVGGSISFYGCGALAGLPENTGVGVPGWLLEAAKRRRAIRPHTLANLVAQRFGCPPLHPRLDLQGCLDLAGIPSDLRMRGAVRAPDGSVHPTAGAARAWFAARRVEGRVRDGAGNPDGAPDRGDRAGGVAWGFGLDAADYAPTAES